MPSKKHLRQNGIKYKQCRWIWERPGYRLSTSEFSDDGSFRDMDYKEYLNAWSNRLNGNITIKKFEIIWARRDNHIYITLVEIMGD
jgi:hypothetical protein